MKTYQIILLVSCVLSLMGFLSYGCYVTAEENKQKEAILDSINRNNKQVFYEPVAIFMQPEIEYDSATGYYYYTVVLTDASETRVTDCFMDSTKSIDSLVEGIKNKIDERYIEVIQGYHIDEFLPYIPGRMRAFYQK